jgi:hypothetical protein
MGTTAAPVSARSRLRTCLAVSGSVLVFAFLIERAGLLPAVVATVFVAALASRPVRPWETLILAAIVAAVVALVFVSLLGQSLDLLAGF